MVSSSLTAHGWVKVAKNAMVVLLICRTASGFKGQSIHWCNINVSGTVCTGKFWSSTCCYYAIQSMHGSCIAIQSARMLVLFTWFILAFATCLGWQSANYSKIFIWNKRRRHRACQKPAMDMQQYQDEACFVMTSLFRPFLCLLSSRPHLMHTPLLLRWQRAWAVCCNPTPWAWTSPCSRSAGSFLGSPARPRRRVIHPLSKAYGCSLCQLDLRYSLFILLLHGHVPHSHW